MIDSVELLGASLGLQLERFQTISSNLANVTTPGFKAGRVAVHSRSEAAVFSLSGHRAQVQDGGRLDATQRALDFALRSDRHFFQLSAEHGIQLTRRGDFHVNAEGYLVSHEGLPVLGDGGAIFLGDAAVRVDRTGTVYREDHVVGRFSIAEVADVSSLTPAGGGRFEPPDGAMRVEPIDVELLQGHLEASNVDPAQEMLTLLALTRHFELGQEALRGHDEMLGLAIGSLGDTHRR